MREMREGNNLRCSSRTKTCHMLEFSSSFSSSPFFLSVTILSRHSSLRMRLGRGHSPTQNSHRTCFFHPPFFIQISIWNEFAGYGPRATGGRSKFISNPPCGKRLSVEYFTLRSHSTDFSHCVVRSIFLTRRRLRVVRA